MDLNITIHLGLKDNMILSSRKVFGPFNNPVQVLGYIDVSSTIRDVDPVVERYSLPNPQSITDRLIGSGHFSKLDIASAYWTIPVRTRDVDKTVLIKFEI